MPVDFTRTTVLTGLDSGLNTIDFHLPAELEAGEPPEARGLRRDEVRLMVSYIAEHRVEHRRFRDLPGLLDPGDVLVINTSATRKAALAAWRASGMPLELHLSTCLPADLWVVELRRPEEKGTLPLSDAQPGERIHLPSNGWAQLLTPYRHDQRPGSREGLVGSAGIRLWIASLHLPCPVEDYLAFHGFPIRYKYVREGWPIEYYQTVYAGEVGSAEMPSAGRAFTPELLEELHLRGVRVAPLVLHTGVASLESHEPPYEEYYRVPAETAEIVNTARAARKRVIAVGTTVVRALETVIESGGGSPGDFAARIHSGEGWTRLFIAPPRRLQAVDGLLTGLHEPRSTHLAMLEALAGQAHLRHTYAEALHQGYLWHEFGDLHLILP